MKRNRPIGYAFIAPATIHLVIFAFIPMAYSLYVSLFKWQLFRTERTFVGGGNYSLALGESAFWNAMANTGRYALYSVPAGMILALAVAILVNQKLKGIAIFRTIFYIPSIASGVAISMLWIYVYLPDTGLINMATSVFGIKSVDFLNRPEWAMLALAFMSMWIGLGPRMVLFLAGLIGIPASLYEAAELDGAGPWRSFWNVTLPMLAPTTLFVLITSTISAMQVFTPVYMMTKGGPEDSTDVVGYHIYSEAWLSFNTGLASAKSFILFVVIALISFAQFRLMKSRMEGYSAG